MTLRKLFLITSIILTLCITTLLGVNAYADGNEISVFVSGNEVEFDVPPTIIENRTLVPMRAIFEELGAKVSWTAETNTIIGEKNDIVIMMVIGDNVMKVNDKDIKLDVAPTVIDGRTLVPVRAIAESFDTNVEWYGDISTISIFSGMVEYASLYNLSGEQIKVEKAMLDKYKAIGWGETEADVKVTMYATDGSTQEVYKSEVVANQGLGWHLEPVQILYAADGRTQVFAKSQVESQLAAGWYVEPVIDITANLNKISELINNNSCYVALQECDKIKSYNMTNEQAAKLNELRSIAQTKYDEYNKEEQQKMLNVYTLILLEQYYLNMKDPSSFKLNSVYAGFNSTVYSGYDFVAVVDVSGKNSYGGITRSTYTMLLKTNSGSFILDLEGYANSQADRAFGSNQLKWMDIAIDALEMQIKASSSLTKLDTDLLTYTLLSHYN